MNAGSSRRGRLPVWARHVLTFGAAFLISLVALDLFIQTAEIQSPMENHLVERIGLMYAPNFKFSRFSEGFFLGRTNSYGCLGKGAPQKKDPNTIRILILGDSFALGHTVFERHYFGRTIEKVVGEATGRPVEVLNFARADFSISNLYQHYVDFASQWDHDLAFFFADQTDLDPKRYASGDFYPRASVRADTLWYDYGFMTSGKAKAYLKNEPLLQHSVLPRFVFEFLKVEDRGDLPHLLLDKFVKIPPPMVAPIALDRAPDPLPQVSRLVLEKLKEQRRVVFVLSGPTHPDYEAVVHGLGIPVLDLNPVFTELESEGVDPYYWKVTGERGHWNQATHVAIGEALGHGALPLLSRR